MTFPLCEPSATADFEHALRDLGARWAAEPRRPRIAPALLDAWDRLLDAWVADPGVPLLVRKARENRGAILTGPAGHTVVPTDNSPAQWAFAVAYGGYCPNLDEIRPLLDAGKLPVAMIFRAAERERAHYRGVRGQCPSTSDAGWKLSHIESVGLVARGAADTFPRATLEHHFRRFMSPRNMLVVPAAWAGLAEVPDFLAGFRQADEAAAGHPDSALPPHATANPRK